MSLYMAQRADMEMHNRSSPFLVHMLYKVALVYLKASQNTPGDSATDKLHVIKQGMDILGRRWNVASTYPFTNLLLVTILT